MKNPYPILHSADAWDAAVTAGTSAINAEMNCNGVGVLADCLSCEVSEERNGEYELELRYSADGIHFADIAQRGVLMAFPNPMATERQPFRIYRITRPIGGRITVYARHISYDLNGVTVKPYSASSAAAALEGIARNALAPTPFKTWTDVGTSSAFTQLIPKTGRQLLGGEEGSILDRFRGEYEFDRYTIKLHSERGRNRGVQIRYGKNLVDLKQEENCSKCYTGVMPFWKSSEDNEEAFFDEEDPIEYVSGTFGYTNIMPLDLSEQWENKPTAAQLHNYARSYIRNNKIGIPTVSLDVKFVQLDQTEEYKNIAPLEQVHLCDTVTIIFEKLGVNATAKVEKTVYDCLKQRFISVEIGDAKSNIVSTIIKQGEEIRTSQKRARTFLQEAVDHATGLITGNKGGNVVLHSSTGQSYPDEILVMDTADIATAQNVWRWNKSGWGHSKTGYNGPYNMAATMEDGILADFVMAGTMLANRIRGGTLALGGMDGADGEMVVYDAKGNIITRMGVDGTTIGGPDNNLQIQPNNIAFYAGKITNALKRMVIDEEGNHFWRDGTYIGRIGTSTRLGATGVLQINLEDTAGGFAITNDTESGSTVNMFTLLAYANGADMLICDAGWWGFGAPVTMNGNDLKDANIVGASAGGYSVVNNKKIPVITSIKANSSGGIDWESSYITVREGMITGVPNTSTNV